MSQQSWNKIVVGVDGSEESREALTWACEHARPGVLVTAVSIWSMPPAPDSPPFGGFPWQATTQVGDATRALLSGVVSEAQATFPEVEIAEYVIAGNAATELIRLSANADLVVVGAKGHGGFTGMLIGSVSQHVLAHSVCTVVVVR